MLRDTTTILGAGIEIGDDGILYYFDNSRFKILSATRLQYGFSLRNRGISISRYMGIQGGNISTHSGYLISKNSVIVCAAARTKNNSYCSFSILRNGSSIGSIDLSNENEKINNTANISITQGDFIQVIVTPSSGVVDYPTITLEISFVRN